MKDLNGNVWMSVGEYLGLGWIWIWTGCPDGIKRMLPTNEPTI